MAPAPRLAANRVVFQRFSREVFSRAHDERRKWIAAGQTPAPVDLPEAHTAARLCGGPTALPRLGLWSQAPLVSAIHVEVDGTPNDRFGYPLPRVEYDIGEHERKMISRMYDVTEEILHEMKAVPLPYKHGRIEMPGASIHEHGTCRMGDDPQRSALDRFNQTHAVKNVYVMNGTSFPTATEENPTLTILAPAWRASGYMAEQLKRREA